MTKRSNRPGGISSVGERAQPSAEEIRSWFDTLSNWSRWGVGDRLGALNYITADIRLAAAQAVRFGVPVSCAWDVKMGPGEQAYGEHAVAQRFMTHTGLGLGDVPPTGRRTHDDSLATAAETILLAFHGRTVTHLDALSHVFWQGQMYGGVPASHVTERDGAISHDVRATADGIISRGVLLDIPSMLGVEALEPRQPIFPADLEAAEEIQGVTVREGDVLLVRTGDGVRRRDGSWNPAVDGQPGLHAACIPWLHDRRVAALGSDVPNEVRPSGYPDLIMPVHSIAVVALGVWLIDNCQLEDLAATCARYACWEFMMTLGPVRLAGVTGGPVNPIAIF